MDAFPLKDSEIDSVTDFIHSLYSWTSKRTNSPSAMAALTNQYESVLDLLGRGDINPELIIRRADPDARLIDIFHDAMERVETERPRDWVLKHDTMNVNLLSPDAFKEALRRFDAQVQDAPPSESGKGVSWAAINREIVEQMRDSAKLIHTMKMEDGDPLITRYNDSRSKLDIRLTMALAGENDAVVNDTEKREAVSRLVAAVILEGTTESERSFFTAWLKTKDVDTRKLVPVDEALNHLDTVLTRKGVGDAVRREINRDMRKSIRDMGAQIDPPLPG